jgi:hypothetical protein
MVCGMQRPRALSAEKGMPALIQRNSIHFNIVSLLLALSITKAITYDDQLNGDSFIRNDAYFVRNSIKL